MQIFKDIIHKISRNNPLVTAAYFIYIFALVQYPPHLETH